MRTAYSVNKNFEDFANYLYCFNLISIYLKTFSTWAIKLKGMHGIRFLYIMRWFYEKHNRSN